MNKFLVVFVDDILVFSRNKEELKLYLWEVIGVLRRNQLKAKFSKFLIWKKEVRFLGHVVSEQGLAADPGKVVAVRDWKTPKNASEVHSFLGLYGLC